MSTISIPFFRKHDSSKSTYLLHPLPRLILAEQEHPRFVQQCEVSQSLFPLLKQLDWTQLPTTLASKRTGWRTIPIAAYVGAFLVKLERQLCAFGHLYRFLREHPALI